MTSPLRQGVQPQTSDDSPDARRRRIILATPWFGGVDGLSVHLHPGTELAQTLLEQRHDAPVRRRTDVHQQVPPTTAADKRGKSGTEKKFVRSIWFEFRIAAKDNFSASFGDECNACLYCWCEMFAHFRKMTSTHLTVSASCVSRS